MTQTVIQLVVRGTYYIIHIIIIMYPCRLWHEGPFNMSIQQNTRQLNRNTPINFQCSRTQNRYFCVVSLDFSMVDYHYLFYGNLIPKLILFFGQFYQSLRWKSCDKNERLYKL